MSLAAPQARLVPLSLPLGFFLLASLDLALGVLLLAPHPEAFLALRHPLLLAAAHLLLLGFGVGVLLGAMHQLVPVLLEVPLPRIPWGYPVLLLWGLGVPLLAWGFLQGLPQGVALGGGLAGLGLWLFAYHMLLAYRSAPRWNRVGTALAWVTFYLALTPLLGLLQALGLGGYGLYRPEGLIPHALSGLLGVFLLSVLGVGYRLVSMFTLSHGVDEEVLGLTLWFLNLGLLGLVLGERLGGVLLGLGVGLALYDTYRILKHRTRRSLDIGVQHYLAALGFLILALGALALGRPIPFGVWFVLGFLGLVITGMLYKILPFLVWTHRYAPKVGRERVPLLKEMLPEGAARLAGGLFALGALLTPFWPQALWLYALGLLPYGYAFWEVMRR